MPNIRSVCIIDDDNIYRFTTQKYIEMLELAERIITFADGEEAIEFFRSNISNGSSLPDLILLDINMPIMDGWDFMEEYMLLLPNMPKEIKLYMVSSSIDERDKNRAGRMDAIIEYIVKPLTEERLIAIFEQ